MISAGRAEGDALAPGPVAVVGLGAAAAMAGFRLGVLPGGLVGVDVTLALVGWWFGSAVRDRSELRSRRSSAWRSAWGPLLVAIALAVLWALMAESVRLDATVRGAALAAFGGYANWHQLSLGPIESLATRGRSPLQHVWVTSVLAQCVLVWFGLVAVTRRRAARRPAVVDPAAPAAMLVALVSFVAGLGLWLVGSSGQALLLSTVPGGTAFFLGAMVGAARGAPLGRSLVMVAHLTRWVAVAGLVACAVLAAPNTGIGRLAGVTVVPLFAALLVAAWSSPEARPAGLAADAPEESVAAPHWWWPVLVTSWFVLTPALAVVRVAWPSSPTVVVDLAGLALAASISVPLASLVGAISMEPAAVERRRVLAPPLTVLLIVVLFSVTGAFHWESPQPRDQWPRPATVPAPPPRLWSPIGTS